MPGGDNAVTVAAVFTAPQTFLIQPSPTLRRLAWALHGLAVLAVLLAALPWGVQALMILPIGISAIRHARCPAAALRLRCHADGRLEGAAADAVDWEVLSVLASSRVGVWLSVLHYRSGDGRRHALAIAADSLPAADFRRLRVWLGWRAAVAQERVRAAGSAPPGRG